MMPVHRQISSVSFAADTPFSSTTHRPPPARTERSWRGTRTLPAPTATTRATPSTTGRGAPRRCAAVVQRGGARVTAGSAARGGSMGARPKSTASRPALGCAWATGSSGWPCPTCRAWSGGAWASLGQRGGSISWGDHAARRPADRRRDRATTGAHPRHPHRRRPAARWPGPRTTTRWGWPGCPLRPGARRSRTRPRPSARPALRSRPRRAGTPPAGEAPLPGRPPLHGPVPAAAPGCPGSPVARPDPAPTRPAALATQSTATAVQVSTGPDFIRRRTPARPR